MVMKITTQIIILLAVFLASVFSFFYFFNRYQSAFEADQQCHFELNSSYSEDATLGCDHDIETRQWILYENAPNGEIAKVLNRFRY